MIEAERTEFKRALRHVRASVSSRPGIPALAGVLVEADGAGRMTVTGTDLEVTVSAELKADGSAARVLVPMRPLEAAVRAGTGAVRLDPTGRDGGPADAVTVDGGSIRLLPVDDFPAPVGEASYVGEVDAASLVAAIAAVEPAASRDQARPILTGILVELAAVASYDLPASRLVATDSYRLHVAGVEGSGDWRGIVPARALRTVARVIGKRATGRITIAATEYEVRFHLGGVGVEVRARLIEGEYPNYRQLLPERGVGTGIRYSRAELELALAQATPYCRDTSPVRLEVSESGVKMSASSPDVGQWVGELAHVDVWSDTPLTVAFNPTYLGGCVAAVGDGATVEIRDGLRPAAFYSSDGAVRTLVMPVRLPA